MLPKSKLRAEMKELRLLKFLKLEIELERYLINNKHDLLSMSHFCSKRSLR